MFILKLWAYRKAIGIGLLIATVILLTVKVLSWRDDSSKLDELVNEVARIEALNQKSHSIGLDLDQGLSRYENEARTVKTPTGATFDADGVQRIRSRLDGLSAARSR